MISLMVVEVSFGCVELTVPTNCYYAYGWLSKVDRLGSLWASPGTGRPRGVECKPRVSLGAEMMVAGHVGGYMLNLIHCEARLG